MSGQPESYEPPARWLICALGDVNDLPENSKLDKRRAAHARLVLRSIECERIAPPSVTRDSGGRISIRFENGTKTLTIYVMTPNMVTVSEHEHGNSLDLGAVVGWPGQRLRNAMGWLYPTVNHTSADGMAELTGMVAP